MPVRNQLPRRGQGGREPKAVDDVVQAAFQELQEALACPPPRLARFVEVAPQLALLDPVDRLELLFFQDLPAVLGHAPADPVSVLTRRVRAL